MASGEDIKAVIEEEVKGLYNLWIIGLTHDPREARRWHGNPLTWFEWEVSGSLSLDIITFFHNKGMQLVTEPALEKTTHLYITLSIIMTSTLSAKPKVVIQTWFFSLSAGLFNFITGLIPLLPAHWMCCRW